MKKILFTLYYMNVGGVEKAFLGMLDSLPHDDLEVHVALMVPEGGFMGYIPSWVHVHTIEPFYRNIDFLKHPVRTTMRDISRLRFKSLRRVFPFLMSKIKGDKQQFVDYLLRGDDALGGIEFDLAVSYASPHEYLDNYVSHHIKARRKAMWIHFDVSKFFNSTRSVMESMAVADRIFVVSDTGRLIFNQKYPELASKTVTFRNIISPEAIRRDAERPSSYRRVEGALNIVTVGRINVEKGQNLAIAAIARLHAMGINAVLHLVGGGRIEADCRQMAVDAGIDDSVRFYGPQPNPYPFMAGADIYLQPSLHEGYCITLAEAKNFSAPIVATDFTGAREQLASRANGVIAADFTPEAIAEAIVKASKMPRVEPESRFENDIDKLLEII